MYWVTTKLYGWQTSYLAVSCLLSWACILSRWWASLILADQLLFAVPSCRLPFPVYCKMLVQVASARVKLATLGKGKPLIGVMRICRWSRSLRVNFCFPNDDRWQLLPAVEWYQPTLDGWQQWYILPSVSTVVISRLWSIAVLLCCGPMYSCVKVQSRELSMCYRYLLKLYHLWAESM